ncbi:MAG: cysteine desulfurase [Anaerolineales bacterium]|nr:cysteine desulfurase [Anaerolineales bacterium]
MLPTPPHPVYLDHSATTPTDPRVLEAMLPYFNEIYGNPSSSHSFGRKAKNAIEKARGTLAKLLNAKRQELIFTACGTESDNLALRGVAAAAGKPVHLYTARTEHHAVSHTADQWAAQHPDAAVTWLPVTTEGRITAEALEHALVRCRPETVPLVSIMYANNEVGTIQPIAELAAIAHAHGALFHTDAVQAAGQLSLDVQALGVDLLSLSAHKFYGPKGVGLLYVREGVALAPAQTGGGQEDNRRAGTHNVPLIIGMARALELAYTELDERVAHYRHMRDRLIDGILAAVPGARLSGAGKADRLPCHASFIVESIDVNMLLMHLDMAGVAASSGSACNTGSPQPSDVLTAMGYPEALALGGLRLTVGRGTTDADINHVLAVLPEVVQRVRTVREVQTVR